MSPGAQSIEIININVTYINTKTDRFDNTICYFKITDSKAKNKLSPIPSQMCDECRLPVWKAEDGQYLIKVKQRYARAVIIPDTALTVKLTFKYYCMNKDDTALQGYYAMMAVMNKSEDDYESDV